MSLRGLILCFTTLPNSNLHNLHITAQIKSIITKKYFVDMEKIVCYIKIVWYYRYIHISKYRKKVLKPFPILSYLQSQNAVI